MANILKKLISYIKNRGNPDKTAATVTNTSLQQSCYTASQFGGKTRKKSFWEKRQAKKNEAKQQSSQVPALSTKTKKHFSIIVPALCVSVLVGMYLLVMGPLQSIYGDMQYFRIHEIEISGCVVTSPLTLREYADISYEMNMLTIDPGSIKNRLEEHPWIATVAVRRIWPDGLAITINENRPHALVVHDGTGKFKYLGQGGDMFATVLAGQEMDYPIITGIGEFETAKEQRFLLQEASTFLHLAGRNNPNLPSQDVSEIHFSNDGQLVIYLVEYPFPIYFGKGEIKRKYYQLRKVLEVLYRKKRGKSTIGQVAYIHMDYQKDKVLVAKKTTS